MKQKIVFMGSGWFVVPVIEKLLSCGLDLVITTDKNPSSPLLKFCIENKLKTITVSSASDLLNQLAISSGNRKSLILDHDIAILASFGVFIPDRIINAFPNGILNIHPSLLPKYKGPSPVQYALLNGETVTGVTLIKLDDQIDHGPILAQKPYQLQGNETAEDLLSILFEIGAGMVEELVTKLENGEKLAETLQDHSKESWSYKIEKKDGMIDINNLPSPSSRLQNMIRAFYPWPGVWFRYAPPVIARSETTKQSRLENKIIKLLPEGHIQVEGKNPMTVRDFVNGFGEEGEQLLKKLHLI